VTCQLRTWPLPISHGRAATGQITKAHFTTEQRPRWQVTGHRSQEMQILWLVTC